MYPDEITRPIRGLLRILVVDDRRENLLAVEAALGKLGALLVPVTSGAEALRYLLDNDVALILLDVQMPGMDGYETAQLIRSRARSAHVPIIFLTAHEASSKNILRAYELGAVDFLFKPFEPEILRAKTQTLLQLQERTEQLIRAEMQREVDRERQRAQASQLAREVAAREHLAELNARLAEADQRKNDFLAVLAHELRNPLAPLGMLFELAKHGEPLQQRMIDVGNRQIGLLSRLIEDLLDISRITANKIELRPERIDLREVVDTAITTSKPRISDKGHELTARIPPEAIHVTVDSVRIVQVISNLLNNAARYTPPNGAITLTCGLESGSAFVSVRDSGIGIPSELLPSIFDMFVQERTRSDGSGGLGLGLALAKQLVTLHGGNISAHSEGRGTGSTFRMEIPAESALRPRTRSSEFDPLQLNAL